MREENFPKEKLSREGTTESWTRVGANKGELAVIMDDKERRKQGRV